jgi:DNA (cytosine-5)-methyltransferase 1
VLRGLDLFCGAGGSSRGALMAGVEMVAAVDMWDVAEETYHDNFPTAKFYRTRCEKLSPAALSREIGTIDILLASPECTSHTCAKGSSRRSEKSRATAFEVIRFAKTLKPRWIVVENVVHMRSWKRYQDWLSALQKLGYHTRTQVLNAVAFGVPQTRRRLFITADSKTVPPVISRRACSPVPVARLIESRNGYCYTPLRKRGRAKPTLLRAGRAISALGKKKPFLIVYYGSDGAGGWQRIDRPLRTITTVDRFAHARPTADGHEIRMLQVPELRRAMGFPAEHVLLRGTRREKIKLLGNAVCPKVMKQVVKSITRRG